MQYRVRIDLSRPVEPDYQQWVEAHIVEIKQLKNAQGQLLFSNVTMQNLAHLDGSANYLVEYTTTPEDFAYYEATHAEHMRTIFRKTYSDISAFTFKR